MNDLVEKAAAFARICHRDQKRKWTGADYFTHVERVAKRVSEFNPSLDWQIAAAYCHDLCEDCGITFGTIRDRFGFEVCAIVRELTNESKQHPDLNRAARKRMDFDNLSRASMVAKRIKAIDRIDNLREMQGAPSDFKALYLLESIQLAGVIDCELSSPYVEELKQLINEMSKEMQ